jgi:Cu+-exporting ATPase
MKAFAVIDGLGCAECAESIERRLEKSEGVRWARVHPPTSTIAVDSEAVDEFDERLRGWLAGSDARLLAAFPGRGPAERAAVAWLEGKVKRLSLRFGIAAALAALVWGEGWTELSPFSVAALSVLLLLVGGAPLHGSLLHALRHRRADAASLLALGVWAAAAHTVGSVVWPSSFGSVSLSGWLALLVVVGLGSALFDGRRRLADAVESARLTRSLASTARVLEDGRERRRPLAEISPGARVAVLPGEALPVDGEVIEGESEVDESFLLGETAAVRKSAGSRVLAGSKNGGGRLVIAASKWGATSLLGTLIESIRDGQSERLAPPQTPADRSSVLAAPAAIALCLAAFVWWIYLGRPMEGVSAAFAILAFSVPPALPAAGLLARLAAREDELSCWLTPDAPERAAGVEMFVLGMTGLFTAPRPRVSAVHAADGAREEEVLGLALVAAAVPEHPYAEAVRRCAADRGMDAGHARAVGLDYYPGRGVRAIVGGDEVWVGSPDWLKSRGIEESSGLKKASLWVAKGRSVVGALEFAAALRPSASSAVEQLKKEGIELVLASGDAEPRVRETAGLLGVESFHWGVAPSDEVALVASLQARGKRVAAMARGLVDAPVLAQADLGLALRPGLPGDVMVEAPDATSVPLALARARQVRFAARWGVAALWTAQAAAAVWTFAYGPSPAAAAGAAALGFGIASAIPWIVRRSGCA